MSKKQLISTTYFTRLFPQEYNYLILIILQKFKKHWSSGEHVIYLYKFILFNQLYVYDPFYVLFVSFILCDKFINDESYSLKYWSNVSKISISTLNLWQIKILKKVNYNLWFPDNTLDI